MTEVSSTRPAAAASPVIIGQARRRQRADLIVWCGILAALLVTSCIAAVAFGAVAIPIRTVAGIVADELGLGRVASGWSRAERNIVWELRLPRVLLGATAGAGLAVIGAVLQVLTRNSLADPYLFGVSAGAAVGAVLVILYIGPFAGALGLPIAAFAGAFAAMVLVFAAARGGGAPTSERLVLTGVAVAFILHAVTNALIVGAADRGAEAALFWMMGGLGNARWATVPVPAIVTLAGTAWLCLRAGTINALAFGDDTARSLGIDPVRLRIEVFVVASLMTGAIVAASGGIGFVGLVLPHLVRLFVGGDLRRLLPLSALAGGLFLVWVDVLARTAFAPREIPLGVVTSLCGGVFFLWLMRRRRI
ncbi:FecCD family ABC transporter permease [Phreatobacter stygius]|uniref:Iron ABC transporter permease n=1 Tax=Phreatobacter stygius TaxID=1940610 RepID=A0A4D7B5J1_9HYPH|nr:iron ABC transporter permease [Phreatobacter stygius]QCI68281.1 iron ABC transporter permease [Phreatobacter stygius]